MVKLLLLIIPILVVGGVALYGITVWRDNNILRARAEEEKQRGKEQD